MPATQNTIVEGQQGWRLSASWAENSRKTVASPFSQRISKSVQNFQLQISISK
jgi:hypothetical protein